MAYRYTLEMETADLLLRVMHKRLDEPADHSTASALHVLGRIALAHPPDSTLS